MGLRERGSSGFSPGPLDFKDLVALHWHLREVPLLLAGVDLDASIGLRGASIHKLTTLLALVQDHEGPWIAVGDWNNEPRELEAADYISMKLVNEWTNVLYVSLL